MVRVSTKPNGAIIAAPPLKIQCGVYEGSRVKCERCEYPVDLGPMTRKRVPAEGYITWDVETGPRPDLLDVTEPFDPASVKLGNLKDPEKIHAKLAEAKAAHENCEGAALCATTGRVIAIGYLVHQGVYRGIDQPGRQVVIDSIGDGKADDDDDERELIARFFEVFKQARNTNAKLAGFSIGDFDVPFLVRRAWILGMDWPAEMFERERYLSPVFCDLLSRWSLSTRDTIKLDSLVRRMGIGQKNGNGAEFARLWEGDRAAAVRYLVNDVHLEYRLGVRMGLPE